MPSARFRTPIDKLPEVKGRIYGGIMPLFDANHGLPAGPPFAAYYNMDMQDLDVEIGIPVGSPQPGFEDILPGELPAGRFARCLHAGPYECLAQDYQALSQWVEEQGLMPGGLAYELDLNDPAGTPPAASRTQILFLLKD